MKNLSIQQINEIYKELAYTIMTEKEFLKIVKNITEKEKDPSIIIEKIREYISEGLNKKEARKTASRLLYNASEIEGLHKIIDLY